MSWEHGTYGWEKYESFTHALTIAGTPYTEELKAEVFVRGWDGNCLCYCFEPGQSCPCCKGTCGHKQHLRIARFTTIEGLKMVVEEYLALDDCDCDGSSVVDIAVYREDCGRPNLETVVLEAR